MRTYGQACAYGRSPRFSFFSCSGWIAGGGVMFRFRTCFASPTLILPGPHSEARASCCLRRRASRVPSILWISWSAPSPPRGFAWP